MIGIAPICLSSTSPAVIGSHRPVGVVNRRRTSFHFPAVPHGQHADHPSHVKWSGMSKMLGDGVLEVVGPPVQDHVDPGQHVSRSCCDALCVSARIFAFTTRTGRGARRTQGGG
jgi:hypothetical protein